MAFPTDIDGTWVNDAAVSYDAGELRRADAAMFAGDGSAFGVSGGIVRHGDTSLEVTVDGSDVVTVQPGAVVIPGDAVTGTGPYRAALSTAATGSLVARHATNGRIDLVVFRQMDTDVVGTHAAYTSRIEIIDGTPSGSPAVPVMPSMSVELGRITVPALGGGAAEVSTTNRTYATALGGTLVVPTSAQLPADAATYQRARALNTGAEYEFNGTSWATTGSGTGWAIKTALETVTSSTTLQADNHLSFTVQAGGSYRFEALLFVSAVSAGANGDFDAGFTFPSGAMHFTGSGPNNADLTTGSDAKGEHVARMNATSGSTSIPFGVSTTGSTYPVGVTIRGTFVAVSAGTVQLVWAQMASSANGTSLLAGSSLKSEQVA